MAPKPKTINPTEHQIQSAVIDWCALNGIPVFAIPNGGHRHVSVARKLQREGVKPGVPDLMIPVMRGKYGGMFLELKAKGGTLRGVQKWWLRLLQHEGFYCAVAYGVDEAIEEIRTYVEGRE